MSEPAPSPGPGVPRAPATASTDPDSPSTLPAAAAATPTVRPAPGGRGRPAAAVALVLLVTAGGIVAGGTIRRAIQGPPDGPRPELWLEERRIGFPFDLSGMLVEREDIRMGGPPKDGIPAIDAPRIVDLDAALAEGIVGIDRVVTVTIEGCRRVYPIRLLRWHEIVNDTLADVPLSVIYCPLCDSVSVVERDHDGPGGDPPDTFGVSGQLLDSNVLVYDRSADGLWSQVEGRSISGERAGRTLVHLDGWAIETLEDVRRHAAEDGVPTTIVAFPEPRERPYTVDPYEQYPTSPSLRFPIRRLDERLPPKVPVVGVRSGDVARAWDLRAVADRAGADGRYRETLGGNAGEVVLGVERGGDGAIRRIEIVSAPEDAIVMHTYWFAWASAHPGTTLLTDVEPRDVDPRDVDPPIGGATGDAGRASGV